MKFASSNPAQPIFTPDNNQLMPPQQGSHSVHSSHSREGSENAVPIRNMASLTLNGHDPRQYPVQSAEVSNTPIANYAVHNQNASGFQYQPINGITTQQVSQQVPYAGNSTPESGMT